MIGEVVSGDPGGSFGKDESISASKEGKTQIPIRNLSTKKSFIQASCNIFVY